MEKETKDESFHLRLPGELKSKIAEHAKKQKRSLNNQIVLVLETYSESNFQPSENNQETALAV